MTRQLKVLHNNSNCSKIINRKQIYFLPHHCTKCNHKQDDS